MMRGANFWPATSPALSPAALPKATLQQGAPPLCYRLELSVNFMADTHWSKDLLLLHLS